MNNDYRIIIRGVQAGHAEEAVGDALAPHLKHPAEHLVPVLRAKKAITLNLKGVPLRGARGVKETYEKIGCACSLESAAPMPPKAIDPAVNFADLKLRTFVNCTVRLAFNAPVNWRDESDENYFKIKHSGSTAWFTGSLSRSPGVDLQVWAEIRLGVVSDKMPYLKLHKAPYSLDTKAGPAIAAEFRGTVPGDAVPTHQLILCLSSEAGAMSLNVTSTVADFEQHESLYRWLLRTQLQLHEIGDHAMPAPSDAEAQYDLGVKFGRKGNHREAVECFRKAAEQGHAEAQFSLASCYHLGEGVPQSYEQAFTWLRKSAEQGLLRAEINLANMYGMGQGVKEDLVQAFHWLLKAAEQGDPDSQYRVALSYIHGHGVAGDVGMAAQWAVKSASQGHPGAQFYVGAMHEGGEGLQQDKERAIAWYRKAANQQHPQAINRLKALGA